MLLFKFIKYEIKYFLMLKSIFYKCFFKYLFYIVPSEAKYLYIYFIYISDKVIS